jgi:hypothetical protein
LFQILSITCDNASNNDKMVEHLATLIEHFPGAANQTRCFTHILNLVAKSILRQFDVKKKTTDDGEPMDFDDAATALAALAQELEDAEDIPEPLEDNEIDDENLETGDDDDDGLGDERKGMSDEEAADLDKNIVPIRLMLTKVR